MMKRVWRIPDAFQMESILQKVSEDYTKLGSVNTLWIRGLSGKSPSSEPAWPQVFSLFADRWCHADSLVKQDMRERVSHLRDELLAYSDDAEKIEKILADRGDLLFKRYADGSAVVELLKQLKSSPELALQAFDWRRRQLDYWTPMTVEEYSKAIVVAGRLKNVDLAAELFKEACNKKLKSTSLYNALMTAYMLNGLAVKCQSVFRDLKREPTCTPTIVTYNILISVCGRLMLTDHMEATLWEINELDICPNVGTFNYLISGYITAWLWDDMEKTYRIMKARSIKPDLTTHLLMLRGYAHSECAGWKNCRSLYHCKMVMYASQRRLNEMEGVLSEMDKVNLYFSKKTFWILLKAYTTWGEKDKLHQVLGMMCKHGYGIPMDG